jgi:hypothetical protein
MPVLPVPQIAPVGGGDLPVTDESDIFSILPGLLKPSDPAPVRDAIISALTAMMLKYQELSSESVTYADVLRSIDSALTGLGEDRGVFRQEGETEENLRARILDIPNIVTPDAIMAAINSIIAPYTTIKAKYAESIQDRWYVGASPKDWHSFVWNSTTNRPPFYPDRLYQDETSLHLGLFLPNLQPGGAQVYSDAFGRFFFIRIPDLSGIDQIGSFSNSASLPNRWFIATGGTGIASGVRTSGTTVSDIFSLIVTTIERLKGNSIRYAVLMDPKLTE